MVMLDFKIGEEDVFERLLICGAKDGSYANVNDAVCPDTDIWLLLPLHAVTSRGPMNLICLFDNDVMLSAGTAFPHTDRLSELAEDFEIGKPVPAIVASIPPPGLVAAGVKEDTVTDIV